MNIIFLDIDGVMNCEEEMIRLLKENTNLVNASLPEAYRCELLKTLINQANAKLIISSSWRLSLRDLQQLFDIFGSYDIIISGITPEYCHASKLKGTVYENIKPKHTHKGWEGYYIEDRGAEIASWLLDHPTVENFVILDDEDSDIKAWFPNNLVKTDPQVGFTLNDCLKAAEILKGGKQSGA